MVEKRNPKSQKLDILKHSTKTATNYTSKQIRNLPANTNLPISNKRSIFKPFALIKNKRLGASKIQNPKIKNILFRSRPRGIRSRIASKLGIKRQVKTVRVRSAVKLTLKSPANRPAVFHRFARVHRPAHTHRPAPVHRAAHLRRKEAKSNKRRKLFDLGSTAISDFSKFSPTNLNSNSISPQTFSIPPTNPPGPMLPNTPTFSDTSMVVKTAETSGFIMSSTNQFP